MKQPPAILPLPPDVVAQIKASTAVVSLTDAVLELLKNSLDAQATRIDASIDFSRGACTVEDDGVGVSPFEFRDEGGLGKRYWTSKHHSHHAFLGRHGTFLASLSAVSLLSVTSRHHQHRSTNSVTFHRAESIHRQIPAPSHLDSLGKHGTRVTVRNLFGNLPVRVKQRSKVVEQKAENERLWHAARHSVAGLLISWGGSVSLKVRDADNHVVFAFNTSSPCQADRQKDKAVGKPRSSHLTSLLNIFTQANYISIGQWSSWVPVSASTPELSVKGAISLEPAPTKTSQFISLGIRPLSADSESNELYNQVNRLFRLSSFGAEEDDTKDHDLKARKGADRYPMFHFRVTLREDMTTGNAQDRFPHDEPNVYMVIEVLTAMIAQWLNAHHFRPRRTRRTQKTTTSSEAENTSTPISPRMSSSKSFVPCSGSKKRSQNSPGTLMTRSKQSCLSASNTTSEKPSSRAFAEWSRIKSGKAEFLCNLSTLQGPVTSGVDPRSTDRGLDNTSGHRSNSATTPFNTQSLAQGSLSDLAPNSVASADSPECVLPEDDKADESLIWVDPTTKKAHYLNARTGCVMPRTTPTTDSLLETTGITQTCSRPSLRLASKTAAVGPTPWLDNILQSWTNPVFRMSEQRIEQLTPQSNEMLQTRCQCYSIDRSRALDGDSFTTRRLSKYSLLSAEVLAQVDKKFILVKMNETTEHHSNLDAPTTVLVLIDQHAADERIQVEALFRELCSPAAAGCSSYQSKLGHCAQVASVMLEKPLQFSVSHKEKIQFTTYAGTFASWGILFDFANSAASTWSMCTSDETSHLLRVTALPPSISERCRADIPLLISFLRVTVWDYHNKSTQSSNPSSHRQVDSLNWVSRLADCPQGLIDMINSRACRSAIMFNDELNLRQCRKLVQDLAACAFPFMCAHGRPSMVPLGDFANTVGKPPLSVHTNESNFLQAWKQWKH